MPHAPVWFLISVIVWPMSSFAQTPADSCSTVSTRQDQWQIVEAGPFSFRLPADYRRVEVTGIDSLVGRWEASPERQVMFDWGRFSSDLGEAPKLLREFSECRETVDGFVARLVMGFDAKGSWGPSRAPKFVVAASWREIGALTFTATGASERDAPTLIAIIRSVVFKK